MEFLFHSPLLFVILGIVLFPRLLSLGKAALATTQSEGTLPIFVALLIIAVLVESLVKGA